MPAHFPAPSKTRSPTQEVVGVCASIAFVPCAELIIPTFGPRPLSCNVGGALDVRREILRNNQGGRRRTPGANPRCKSHVNHKLPIACLISVLSGGCNCTVREFGLCVNFALGRIDRLMGKRFSSYIRFWWLCARCGGSFQGP